MHYMIIRRANRSSEAANLAPAEAARLLASLQPSTHAVRLTLDHGRVTVQHGPFPDPAEMIAGFGVLEAASKDDAIARLRDWPVQDEALELELRESGCPGGCAQVQPADLPDARGKRFAVLLRSSADLENEVPVPQERLDRLDAANAASAAAGVLLAGDGLRTSARGARVKVARNAFAVVDGPFTEIKEMIAGFWMIRVASMDDAIAWASRNPYPSGDFVEVEIRELAEADSFTPELQAAEQRMRAEQLEQGMHATWR
jgi:hypothetical protein